MKSNRLEWYFVEQDLMTEAKNLRKEELKGYAAGLMDAIYIAPNWSTAEWAIRRLVLLAQLDISKFDDYWDSGITSMIMLFVGTGYKALTGVSLVDYTPAHGNLLERLIMPGMPLQHWIKHYQYK